MLKLKDIKIVESKKELEALPEGKLLINTINAHSYNTALKDTFFAEALMKGDALIPDGAYSGGYPFSISGDIRSVPS